MPRSAGADLRLTAANRAFAVMPKSGRSPANAVGAPNASERRRESPGGELIRCGDWSTAMSASIASAR